MNSTMIAQSATETQESFRQWLSGFNAYVDRQPYSEAQSCHWRQGYRDARAGEAQCNAIDTAAHCGKHLHAIDTEAELIDYVEGQLDQEYWRYGQW